jgi:hypothetical protein
MRKSYFFGTLCLLLLAGAAFAQPLGWSYIRGITVVEQSGTNLVDYQMKLYFDTQTEILAGRMLASGDDIRFGTNCAGTTLLNHWIEGPMNDDSTVIWVKIPSIPASGSTTISMFFGNPSAPSTSAVAGTFIGPHSATDSVASGGAGGATNSQRGFRFAPNQDLLVTSFGKREPNGTVRYVTLFNFATQAIVNQVQVSGPAAQYSYASLAAPIWLTSGTQYLLQLYQGASDGYYFGTSSQIGQHLTYFDMRYCNSCTQNTFPTNTLSNYHYGYPDLWYFTRQSVTPAPTYSVSLQGAFGVVVSDPAGCEADTMALSPTYNGATGSTTCVWSSGVGLSDSTSCTPTVTIGNQGSYVLTVTDSVGCIGTATVTVVNNTPSVAVSYDTTTICVGDTIALTATGADAYSWGPGTTLSAVSGTSVNAFPTVTTTYLLQGADTASGCMASDTFTVNVSDVSVDVVLGPLGLCEGESITLIVTGADDYQWSPGTGLNTTSGDSVIATPTTTTTYTIIGTDTATSCTATNSVEIVVFPAPVVTFDLPDHFCDTDPDAPLTAGTPAGGTYSGPFVTANTFSPSTATTGSYNLTYTYTDSNGCEASDTALAIVDLCIGVAPSLLAELGFYPNPSNGVFTVMVGGQLEAATFRVMNMMGQVIREGMLENGKNVMDLGAQPAGLYVLTVEAAGQQRSFNLEIRR